MRIESLFAAQSVGFAYTDWVILVLYFALTMVIGLLSMRKGNASVEGYVAAERSLPGWLTGLSILGSFVSSISFLALPGKAFNGDWNPFVFSIAMPLATFISVKYFLPFYRSVGSVSAYEHLEERFGAWARVYPGVCYLLTQLARMGAVTYLMALPMSVLLGWDIYTVILITGVAVTLYTFAGGIVGVIWTEAVQTAVLMGGAVFCALYITFALPEGFAGFVKEGFAEGKFGLGSFDFSFASLAQTTFWVMLFYGLFINLQNFGIDQNYVQRYITAKSDKEARKGLWFGGLVYLPISAIFFYIGTALYFYYKAYPALLPAEYAGKPDYVFPYFMVSELPVGLKGLLIASVFAAAMSTVSCSLNSSATIMLKDYYERFINKNASAKSKMTFLRVVTVAWGLLGTLMALIYTRAENALDVFWYFAGVFGGGMLGLFLLGLISKRATSLSAGLAVIFGVLVIAWMTFSAKVTWLPISPFSTYLIPVFGTAAIFVGGFIFTFALSKIFKK